MLKTKNLKTFLNKIIHIFVVLTVIGSQVVYANPAGDGSDRIDFQKIGLDPDKMIEIKSENVLPDGQVEKIDLFQTMASSAEAVQVFKALAPKFRAAHEKNPNEQFKFLYLPDGSPAEAGNDTLTAQQIVSILDAADGNTTETKIEVADLGLLASLRQSLASIFNETTPKDIQMGFVRLTINGLSTTYCYALRYPLPVALVMGALTSISSFGFGILLKKYVRWLKNNGERPDASRLSKFKDRLYSPETLMLMSPFLIGLQDRNLSSMLHISAAVGATVVVQNVYRYLKSKFPHKAFLYKWYATEEIFSTLPFAILPIFGIYTHRQAGEETLLPNIEKTYLVGLITTASQGVSDNVTTAIQETPAKAAEQADQNLFSKRFGEQNIFAPISDRDRKQFFDEFALKVDDKYKKYYLGASLISVASMTLMQLGNFNHNTAEVIAGTIGLASLTVISGAAWSLNKIKKIKKAQLQNSAKAPLMCSALFAL